jgi:uncharacterized protein (TIGR00369 family)
MSIDLVDKDFEDSWGDVRSRTVTWRDPGPSTAKGMTMPGIDYLRATMDHQLPQPPIMGLMHLAVNKVSSGRVVITCAPDESMYNATGMIHGGVVCTLLDTVAGCALLSTLPRGKGLSSVEIKVNYLKTVHPGSGPLTATGTVVKAGARIGFTEGVVTNASGAIVATASSTMLIFDV